MSAGDALYAPIPARVASPADARAHPMGDGFWALRFPLAYAHAPTVNGYLLEMDDGWLLIDCGSSLPPGWDGVSAALALAGVAPSDVSVLLTTHHHSDHAGLASRVIAETGCAYWHLDAPATLTEPLREHDRSLDERRLIAREQGIPDWLADLWVANHVAADGTTPIPPGDRLLREGDVLATLAGDWVVHPGPGHCAGQLMLYQPQSGRLVSADAVLRVAVPYVEWRHRPDAFGDHLRSIDLVERLAPTRLLPGHGRPVEDVAGEVGFAREAALAVRDQVRSLLADGPTTPYDLVHRYAAPSRSFDFLQLAMSTVLAVLDHLELAGEVRSHHDDRGVRLVEKARGVGKA